MLRLTALASFALMALAADPAAAAQWRLAAMSGERPDRMVFFVDAESIRREGDDVRFWTQTIVERATSAQDWDRSVTYRHGSCVDSSSAIVQNSFYNAGRLLETDGEARPRVFHQPDSVMYGVMQAVCGREAWASDPVADPEPTIRRFFAQEP